MQCSCENYIKIYILATHKYTLATKKSTRGPSEYGSRRLWGRDPQIENHWFKRFNLSLVTLWQGVQKWSELNLAGNSQRTNKSSVPINQFAQPWLQFIISQRNLRKCFEIETITQAKLAQRVLCIARLRANNINSSKQNAFCFIGPRKAIWSFTNQTYTLQLVNCTTMTSTMT